MPKKIDHRVQKRLLLGLGLSSIISLFAYQRRSLSRSGIAGAIITGTIICGLGSWSWGLALVYFFASSSLFSHFRAHDKAQTAADKFSKGGQRDIAQVAANGGMATLFALAHGLTSSPRTQVLLQAGYIGALATATADTWATELGVLSPQPPRLITTGHTVTPGTSGGITPLGIGASATGALSLGLFFGIINRRTGHPQGDAPTKNDASCDARHLCRGIPLRVPCPPLPWIALISGLTGSLADSMLGATVQAMYYCPLCLKETERRVHNCGTKTQPLRGIVWMNNDVVNFLATLIGGVVAMLLHSIFF